MSEQSKLVRKNILQYIGYNISTLSDAQLLVMLESDRPMCGVYHFKDLEDIVREKDEVYKLSGDDVIDGVTFATFCELFKDTVDKGCLSSGIDCDAYSYLDQNKLRVQHPELFGKYLAFKIDRRYYQDLEYLVEEWKEKVTE